MALYKYVKSKPSIQAINLPSQGSNKNQKTTRKIARLLAPILVTVGSVALANVAWPIISHQFFVTPTLTRVEFTSPVPKNLLGSNPIKQKSNPQIETAPPQVLGAGIDYTNARNWFPDANFANEEEFITYVIDIPAVGIENAKVVVGGDDLSESLIHYPGTSKPGQFGAPVIFGHSVLRQFYNPSQKNPHRYDSIFSKIMTLKNSDRIFITYDNIRYTYEVRDRVEVQPEDLFILEQQYSNKELKLITCTPEGTYLRRGVIIAQLVNLTQDLINNSE